MRFSIDQSQVVWQTVDGETTVVHTETTNYYGLNPTGAFVWNFLCTRDASLEEIVNAVSEEYNVEPTVVRGDVEGLLQELQAEKLIVER